MLSWDLVQQRKIADEQRREAFANYSGDEESVVSDDDAEVGYQGNLQSTKPQFSSFLTSKNVNRIAGSFQLARNLNKLSGTKGQDVAPHKKPTTGNGWSKANGNTSRDQPPGWIDNNANSKYQKALKDISVQFSQAIAECSSQKVDSSLNEAKFKQGAVSIERELSPDVQCSPQNDTGVQPRTKLDSEQYQKVSSFRPYSNASSRRKNTAAMTSKRNQVISVKTNRRLKEKNGNRKHRVYQKLGASRCSELEEEIEDFTNDQRHSIDGESAPCETLQTSARGDDPCSAKRNIRNWLSGLDGSTSVNVKSPSFKVAKAKNKKSSAESFSQREEFKGTNTGKSILGSSIFLDITDNHSNPQADSERNKLQVEDEIVEYSDGNDDSKPETSNLFQDDSQRVFPSLLDRLDITNIGISLQPLRSRKRSRNKGELGQCLNRYFVRKEQEHVLFKHASQNHRNDMSAGADSQFFCAYIQSLSFEMNLVRAESKLCHNCENVETLTLFLLFPKNVWKDLGFHPGQMIKINMPWHAFTTNSGKFILCSEKCAHIDCGDLGKETEFQQGRAEKALCDVNSKSTIDFYEFCKLDTLSPVNEYHRLHIGNFEALNLNDCNDAEDSQRITCISNIHPFMVDVSVIGQIIQIHPRHLLISKAALGDVDSSYRELLAKTNYSDLSVLQPSFVISDKTEKCTINVPVPFVNKWMEPLLSANLDTKFEFHCLSIAPITTVKNNSKLIDPTRGNAEMPLELVVTEKSYFCKLNSGEEHSNADVWFPKVTMLGTVSEINVRVNILLVQLIEVLTLPHPTKFQIWLSVREKSLEQQGISNVLVYITDACQVLACQSVLKPGDMLLIRNAVVVNSCCCDNSAPHSNLVCIDVDSLSQVVKVGCNPEIFYEESENQFILPHCFAPKSLLQEHEKNLDTCYKSDSFTGSCLHFQGKIAKIDAVKFSRICPECKASGCFREIEVHDEKTARMSCNLCLKCGFLDHRSGSRDIESCHLIVQTVTGKEIDCYLDHMQVTQLLASLSDTQMPDVELLRSCSIAGTGFWWCTTCADGLQDGMQLQVVKIALC